MLIGAREPSERYIQAFASESDEGLNSLTIDRQSLPSSVSINIHYSCPYSPIHCKSILNWIDIVSRWITAQISVCPPSKTKEE